MSVTPAWLVIAMALFFALDLIMVGLVIAKRRKSQYRGFEVLVGPEKKEQ